MKQNIEDRIFDFFTTSSDFNGIPLWSLCDEYEVPIDVLIDLLKELISENKVSIQSSSNPHIIGFQHYDIGSQIKILQDAKTVEIKTVEIGNFTFVSPATEFPICLYPSKEFLISKRDISEIKDSPYTLQLALAEPQLTPIFFEIEVLDRYFNDPRFNFKFKDYSGSISCLYDKNHKPILREEDQIFIKTFGLGFDSEGNRLAVVYLRYLNDLTKEHQVFWKSKESKQSGKVLTEYYENTIQGNWTASYSIFTGFIGELTALNKLAKSIFKKQLFKRDFENENRPKEFTFFFTPTLKNYNDFVLLLDKMLSDNINYKFFKGEIDLFDLQEIEVGLVERKTKGSIRLFEEWLLSQYNIENQDLLKAVFKPLKRIRNERQNPAHRIDENTYDVKYIKMQKEMINEAYDSIKAFREIFQRHPKANDVDIPDWLDKGAIKTF